MLRGTADGRARIVGPAAEGSVDSGSVPEVLAFLSVPWLEALDAAASADEALAVAVAKVHLAIEHHVTDVPGGGVVTYYVAFDQGRANVGSGPAPSGLPVVRFTQTHPVALAIARGDASAQRAFMTGDVRVGGDLTALLANQAVLAGLPDAFASVRDQTDLSEPA